ncbi:MAG: hypothetical protein HC836_46925 [Richelia sp. RM2_1_2]|nr:hypothetical protein [Richelia sp. RM2_1_2]
MKEYFIFPTSGNPIAVTKEGENFKLSINESINPDWTVSDNGIIIKFNHFSPRFTKEELVKQLTQFVEYVKKYG